MPNGPWPAQLTDLIRSTPGWDAAMRWHYALLLNNMWHNDCMVANDLGEIADLSGLNRARNWREKAEKLRCKLDSYPLENGKKVEFLTHPRLLKDAEKVNKQSELQRERAKKRWENGDAAAMPDQNAAAMPPSPSPSPIEKPKGFSYTADFETFWQAYPSRQNSSKRKGFSAWQARLKEGATVEEIVHGARCYRSYCEATDTTGRFIAQHTTWLNQARYEEYHGRTPDLVYAEARTANQSNSGRKRSDRDEIIEATRRFVARGGVQRQH